MGPPEVVFPGNRVGSALPMRVFGMMSTRRLLMGIWRSCRGWWSSRAVRFPSRMGLGTMLCSGRLWIIEPRLRSISSRFSFRYLWPSSILDYYCFGMWVWFVLLLGWSGTENFEEIWERKKYEVLCFITMFSSLDKE